MEKSLLHDSPSAAGRYMCRKSVGKKSAIMPLSAHILRDGSIITLADLKSRYIVLQNTKKAGEKLIASHSLSVKASYVSR